MLAALAPLFAVAIIVYVVRVWTRMRPKNRLNAADHAVTVAFVRAPLVPLTSSHAPADE